MIQAEIKGKAEPGMKKMRQTNFEWIRILSMLMIITLHNLDKGGFLTSLAGGPLTKVDGTAWLIEAFCLVSVNVYVLISGYFAQDSTYKFGKVIRLWRQVFTYSVAVLFLALIFHIYPLGQLNLYEGITFLFPIVTEEYWFATAYVFLFLLMPFLNAGMEKISQKTFQQILLSLIFFFSVCKSVLPMHLPWDHYGYDVLWFICLYLMGAYIRRYGLKMLQRMRDCVILYVSMSLLTFLIAFGLHVIYLRTGKLADFTNYGYTYNHITCFLGSLGFFGIGMHIKQIKGRAATYIVKISGATFGVYLLHEHPTIRGLWQNWLGADLVKQSFLFIPQMIFAVIVVFTVGTVIEIIRQYLEGWIGKRWKRP